MTFSNQMNGRNNVVNARKGAASHSALFSGSAIAMFFGAISPITMWRKTTIVRAIAKDTECRTVGESSNNGSMPDSIKRATAGSATAPSPSDAIVMPSCAPASIRESSFTERSATLARLWPSAASCSIFERRAAMRANSAPTKKPFSSRRAIAIAR
jgi:hypothetical protein